MRQKIAFLLFFVCCAWLGVLTSCSNKQASDTPQQNAYISAFTSGKVSRYASIYVMLSTDIDSATLKKVKPEKVMKISPEPAGQYSFADAHTIVFQPKEPLVRDKEYSVSVDLSKVFETNGSDDEFNFKFQVKPLLLSVYTEELSETEDDVYEVAFTVNSLDREDSTSLAPVLKLSPATKFSISSSSSNEHVIKARYASAATDQTVQLIMNDGQGTQEVLHECTVPRKGYFDVYNVDLGGDNQQYIDITFTKKLDANQKTKGLAYIEGNTSKQVSVEGNRLRLYPDNGRQGSVEVILSANIRSSKGLTLGADKQLTVELAKSEPKVAFAGSTGTIIPISDNEIVPFSAVYMRAVTVAIFRIFGDKVGQMMQNCDISENSSLSQIAYPVAVKTIRLDQKNADLTRPHTYAFNVKELMETEPGAIYRLELFMLPQYSAWPDYPQADFTDADIEAADKALFDKLSTPFNDGYYYGHWNMFDYEYSDNEDPSKPSFYNYQNANTEACRNVLATNIGLTACAGTGSQIKCIALDLRTTMPMSGVAIDVMSYQGRTIGSGTTDGSGMADITYKTTEGKPTYIVARNGNDINYLRIDPANSLSTSTFNVSGETVRSGLKGFIYGERGVWRPGDNIHLSFILSDRDNTLPVGHPVTLKVTDARGRLICQQVKTDGKLGLYSWDVPTDPTDPTGVYTAVVSVGNVQFEKSLRIEAIKPNRMKIELSHYDVLTPQNNMVSLHTEWLNGATTHDQQFTVSGTFVKAHTTWKGLEEYNFDDNTKTCQFDEEDICKSTTDDNGNTTFRIGLTPNTTNAPGMLNLNLTTRVYEASGEFSTDYSQVRYSPYYRYVGLASPAGKDDRQPLETGKDNIFRTIVVNADGKPQQGVSLQASVYKKNWYWWWQSGSGNMADFAASEYETPFRAFNLTTDIQGKASFKLNVGRDDWGAYLIVVKDGAGHRTSLMTYIDWPDMFGKRSTNERDAAVTMKLQPSKKSYNVGDEANISFPSSAGSKAIVNICNGTRVIDSRLIDCNKGTTQATFKVTEDMLPNVYACISVVQPYDQTANDMPIRLYGIAPIAVESPLSHLVPVISMDDEIRPLEKTTISIKENDKRPMAYTLAVVDEGLLDLTHFATPDPWTKFNGREALGVRLWDVYSNVSGAFGGRIEQMFSVGGDGFFGGGGKKAFVNRFTPMVHFEGPYVLAKGETRKHTIDVPNYNGRVRVMVVAADGVAYGNAEKSVKVSRPLMLIGTMPRLVGADDETTIAATVFATKNMNDVTTTLSVKGDAEIVGPKSQTINFGGQTGDKTVQFRLRAGKKEGKIEVSLTAQSGSEKTNYSTLLDVRRVSQTIVKTTSATLAAGKTWKGNLGQKNADGHVDIELSNSQPLNLAGRLSNLLSYPHGCAEQITSKAFPQLYLSEFTELTAEQQKAAEDNVKSVISRLKNYATSDGGMAYWPGSPDNSLWASAYVYTFLCEADRKGYLVPSNLKSKLRNYLRTTVRKWQSGRQYSWHEDGYTLALYALASDGKSEQGIMNRIFEDRNRLSDANKNKLSAAFAVSGQAPSARKSIGAADDAMKLVALTALNDASVAEVAEKIRKELVSDNWLSTYNTALNIMAMSKYFARNPVNNHIDATIKADGKKFASVSTDKRLWNSKVADTANADLEVSNNGNGTIFIEASAYSLVDQGQVSESTNGLRVAVSYQGMPVEELQQGTTFTASVSITNTTSRTLENVAITHILPAGWEILKFAEANSSSVSYADTRDDRQLTYINSLRPQQTVTYNLDLSATYAGKYYAPAITAEAMYDATTTGNTSSTHVIVE